MSSLYDDQADETPEPAKSSCMADDNIRRAMARKALDVAHEAAGRVERDFPRDPLDFFIHLDGSAPGDLPWVYVTIMLDRRHEETVDYSSTSTVGTTTRELTRVVETLKARAATRVLAPSAN